MTADIFTASLKPGIEQDAVGAARSRQVVQAQTAQEMMKRMVGDDGLEPPTSSV